VAEGRMRGSWQRPLTPASRTLSPLRGARALIGS